MNRSLAFLTLLLAAAPVRAATLGETFARSQAFAARASLAFKRRQLPLATVTETQAYATIDEAAVAALRLALPLSRDYENGGFILKRDGSYFYSDPVSSHGTADIAFRADIPKGGRMAAIYHTHPSDEEDAKLFSAHDVVVARQLGLPSYIGVWSDGTVRLFDSHTMKTRPYSDDFIQGRDIIADGKVIAKIDR